MPDPEKVAASLTKAQQDIMTRPNGTYQDDGADILALMNLGLIGTVDLPLGTAVRPHLLKGNPDNGE